MLDLLREDATAHTAVDPTRIASRLGVSAIEVIDALDDLQTFGLISSDHLQGSQSPYRLRCIHTRKP